MGSEWTDETVPVTSPQHTGSVPLTVKGHILYEAHIQGEFLGQGHKVQELILIQASHHHTVYLVKDTRTLRS